MFLTLFLANRFNLPSGFLNMWNTVKQLFHCLSLLTPFLCVISEWISVD